LNRAHNHHAGEAIAVARPAGTAPLAMDCGRRRRCPRPSTPLSAQARAASLSKLQGPRGSSRPAARQTPSESRRSIARPGPSPSARTMSKFAMRPRGDLAMNVSLTPQLKAMIRERVESGRYNNASEVVRQALRLAGRARTGAAPAVLARRWVRGRAPGRSGRIHA
jgi:putative addiction module CopG family antidote